MARDPPDDRRSPALVRERRAPFQAPCACDLRVRQRDSDPYRSGHAAAGFVACGARRGGPALTPARGIEILDTSAGEFAPRLRSENHTLKRALTDPRLFSGVGNAYSDEILHAARLSPIALTQRLSDEEVERLHAASVQVLQGWTERLRAEAEGNFPRASPPSARGSRSTGASGNHARCAEPRSSGYAMPATKPTTARAARPAVASSPTDRCRGC